MSYNPANHTLFMFIYGFLAWVAEVIFFAVRDRRYVNRGLLTLPIDFESGVVFSNLIAVLPTMGRNYVGMYILTFANVVITRAVFRFFGGRLTKNAEWLGKATECLHIRLAICALTAEAILLVYLLVNPILLFIMSLIPDLAVFILSLVGWTLIIVDFTTVIIAVHKGRESFTQRMDSGNADHLSTRISNSVWRRLERAYPGIRDEGQRSEIVFAQGMSLDKLIWVFLISALVGDIIETFYCRLTGGVWMSRSSVVFGQFSFVWGIGAVLLTVSLIRLQDKNDRWVLLGGAILGGAFEYMCSVFTELVFGKVFWDYSYMPLNINGRTNVLFMFFWGVLGLVWVKIAFPPLDRLIERFPPLAAKVLTWMIMVLMISNAIFTMAVMIRYNERQTDQHPSNALEEFIDEDYNDDFVEKRWPNMITSE